MSISSIPRNGQLKTAEEYYKSIEFREGLSEAEIFTNCCKMSLYVETAAAERKKNYNIISRCVKIWKEEVFRMISKCKSREKGVNGLKRLQELVEKQMYKITIGRIFSLGINKTLLFVVIFLFLKFGLSSIIILSLKIIFNYQTEYDIR